MDDTIISVKSKQKTNTGLTLTWSFLFKQTIYLYIAHINSITGSFQETADSTIQLGMDVNE